MEPVIDLLRSGNGAPNGSPHPTKPLEHGSEQTIGQHGAYQSFNKVESGTRRKGTPPDVAHRQSQFLTCRYVDSGPCIPGLEGPGGGNAGDIIMSLMPDGGRGRHQEHFKKHN
jgi:hypothetical protein